MQIFGRRGIIVFLIDVCGLVCLVCLLYIVFLQHLLKTDYGQGTVQFATVADIHGRDYQQVGYGRHPVQLDPKSVTIATTLDKSTNNTHCTMGGCFDIARCRPGSGFRVYVYPDVVGVQSSQLYSNVLKVIRSSRYYTDNPSHACLFVPSIDPSDRDRHSKDYVKDLPSRWARLPHWRDGRNHVVFNLYSGTWPDYQEEMDFNTGKAILARASFNGSLFRRGFDISLPLFHKDHPKTGGEVGLMKRHDSLFPLKRKYLLAFKGKRYLYGQGKELRSSVYHLHNGDDIIMLTTCKHNQDWLKRQDSRCGLDNELYDK